MVVSGAILDDKLNRLGFKVLMSQKSYCATLNLKSVLRGSRTGTIQAFAFVAVSNSDCWVCGVSLRKNCLGSNAAQADFR